ncbi:hypothetical protein [Algoriella sp.]|uniref:hypothetical protein n=1 Tax=Algoriella sp. TaxID=1872434 RepID=UPI001B19F73F|nr:hypothetical protein [Algoriella sp.]MBO6213744.1 hypothetical protein [Algoriella sp.]
MAKLTIHKLDSYKRQMEATISNPQGLYIVSKINVVLSDLLKDSRFSKNEQLIEIYNEVLEMKEPNNYYTYRSEYPENFDRLQKLYPIVIDEIKMFL